MKTKLITLALCLALIITTSSCGKPKPSSVSGNMGARVYDTPIYFYHTNALSKNKKQEIIVAFWDNNPEYPPESSFSGGESSAYLECRLTKSYPTVKLQCFAKFDRKSGKGKVNINGEKFDVSNGRLFLINTLVKPIKVIQLNEQFNLPPFNNMSSLDNWSFTKKSVLNAHSSCDKKFQYLAENNKIVAVFLADAKKSYEKNKSKDLKNKD